LHGKPIRFELNREEPGTGEKNKKDVNVIVPFTVRMESPEFPCKW
jgi:hypothetical protein